MVIWALDELWKYQRSSDIFIKRLPVARYWITFKSIEYYSQQPIIKNPFPFNSTLIWKSSTQIKCLFSHILLWTKTFSLALISNGRVMPQPHSSGKSCTSTYYDTKKYPGLHSNSQSHMNHPNTNPSPWFNHDEAIP